MHGWLQAQLRHTLLVIIFREGTGIFLMCRVAAELSGHKPECSGGPGGEHLAELSSPSPNIPVRILSPAPVPHARTVLEPLQRDMLGEQHPWVSQ